MDVELLDALLSTLQLLAEVIWLSTAKIWVWIKL
jgi:hypothetical protein